MTGVDIFFVALCWNNDLPGSEVCWFVSSAKRFVFKAFVFFLNFIKLLDNNRLEQSVCRDLPYFRPGTDLISLLSTHLVLVVVGVTSSNKKA